MQIDYRDQPAALTPEQFIALATKIWAREYDVAATRDALARTMNISAWDGDRLVGTVRILTDGYFFSTVPEIMVDPDYRRQGIGAELMRRALAVTPGGVLFFGAQPGQEAFFERAGFRRGLTGFVGRAPVKTLSTS